LPVKHLVSDVETRYSQIEKKAQAIVHGYERFRYYLVGGPPFLLITDHKPLEYIMNKPSKKNARLDHWLLRLQEFDFKLVYQPGKQNFADALSQLVKTSPIRHNYEDDFYLHWIAENATPEAMTLQEIKELSTKDPYISKLRNTLRTDIWFPELSKYERIKAELSIYEMVLRDTRIVVPPCLRLRALSLAHEGHLGVTKTKQQIRTKLWWPEMDSDVEIKCKRCPSCQLVSSLDPPEPIVVSALPDHPWEYIGVDYLGPLPNGQYILVVVDYSRFVEVIFTRSTTSESTISHLSQIFARFGIPQRIRVDRGPQFVSQEFRDFCNQIGTLLITRDTLRPTEKLKGKIAVY
jgi:transposase InsO family protein